ncbi:MAG: RNA polymerase sigma factor [Lachnospiraceae bacterium]|nr:RNA polymerase sigma factor [Lachnospiraceae bacterium]
MKDITEIERQAYEREQELMDAIVKLQAGDTGAFDTIYQYTYKFMFQKAGQLLANYYNKDSELRNDLVQDAYIKVFRNIASLQDACKFYGWLNAILVHTIYAYTRAHWREEFNVVDDEGKSVIEEMGQTADTPESRMIDAERLDYIHGALATLPPLQRCTVEYYYFSEMSVEEIARLCECSEGTVKSRLNYARKKLKDTIEEIEKTKGIKLHGIFAMPLLLFLAKESAYAAELGVDASTAMAVRNAVYAKCVPGAPMLQSSVAQNASGPSTMTSVQNTKGEQVMTEQNINVSSKAVSIWKTALGKVIISVTVVVATTGVIMGGLFVFGNNEDTKEDDEVCVESTIDEDEDEDKDAEKDAEMGTKEEASPETTVAEETTVTEEATKPQEEVNVKSLVAEDGYIHIGSADSRGVPSVYQYNFHEDIEYRKDIRKTYFPLGEEVLVDISYYDAKKTIEKKEITGTYTVSNWPEGLVLDGITAEDFTNSGATGLYLDGSTVSVCWVDEDSVNAERPEFFTLIGEGGVCIAFTRPAGTVEEQYQARSIKPGDCLVPSFYVKMTDAGKLAGEVVWEQRELADGALALTISDITTITTKKNEYKDFQVAIDHSDSVRSTMELNILQDSDSTSVIHSYTTYETSNLPEELQKYLYAGYTRNGENQSDDYDDPNRVGGRMLTSLVQNRDLLQNYYRKPAEAYTQADSLLDKITALEVLKQPVSIVLYDQEYRFYAYDANVSVWSDEYETNDAVTVWGYAIPTGNVVTLEETDAVAMSKVKPKDVEIPDITLVPVDYYDRETGMGKLKAVDDQINEIYGVLQTEVNAYMTTPEQAEAVKTLLQKARELYFIVCADNACMKSYSEIGSNAKYADFGLADFSTIMARYEEKGNFSHYMNVYMYQHIDCMDGKLQVIKDTLPLVNRSELTKTQKTALEMTEQLLDVFYANTGNYETVVEYYNEYAGKTYNEGNEDFRKLTDYDARLDSIIAYRELIAEFPEWVILE